MKRDEHVRRAPAGTRRAVCAGALSWALSALTVACGAGAGGPAGEAGGDAMDGEDKAASATLEAEAASLRDCRIRSGGYVDFGGQGASLEWSSVDVAPGTHTLTFRYANGSASARSATVIAMSSEGERSVELAFRPTGSWDTWKTESVQLRLDARSRIRVTATRSSGGPNLDWVELRSGSGGSNSGSGGSNSVGSSALGVAFDRYTEIKGVKTLDANGAKYFVYAESSGRNGHNDAYPGSTGFVKVTAGADLVGYGGGRDKYLALYRIRSPTVTIDPNGSGASYVAFVSTSRTLEVVKACSIDPSIDVAYKQCPIGRSPLPSPGRNQLVVYAEDEGKYEHRIQQFREASPGAWVFGQGDDRLLMFPDGNLQKGPNGNGAYMILSVR